MRGAARPLRGRRRARLRQTRRPDDARALRVTGPRTAAASTGRSIRPARSAAGSRSISSSIRTLLPVPPPGRSSPRRAAPVIRPPSRVRTTSRCSPAPRDARLVLMDNRGTGKSGAIDCPALQTAEQWTVELVGACGASLGERAALYSTAYAADDLAAVIEALEAPPIDLYGDSYGTYFEQVFALRHPRALRSVVLDGAYPVSGPDYPWYPTYAPAMRAKFDLACRRSPSCARLPGSSIDHVMPVLEELRRAALRGPCLRRRRPRALLSGRCVASRHRHVRERARPGDRQGGRRRRTRVPGRRSGAAPAPHR